MHWDLGLRLAQDQGASADALSSLLARAAQAAELVDTGYASMIRMIERAARTLPMSDRELDLLSAEMVRLHDALPAAVGNVYLFGLEHGQTNATGGEIERPSPLALSDAHQRLIVAVGFATALATVPSIGDYCVKRASSTSADPRLISDCRRLAQLRADHADTVSSSVFGLNALAQLAASPAQRTQVREARLQVEWLNSFQASAAPVCLGLRAQHAACSPEERVFDLLSSVDALVPLLEPGMTELQLLRDRAKAAGQPLPPDAWLQARRTRMATAEGR